MNDQHHMQIHFVRPNGDAWKFAWKAHEDYMLARYGIRNGLWSGFEMATQAAEKLLKSYLLFADKSLSGSGDAVRKAVSKLARSSGREYETSHDIDSALKLAVDAGLPMTPGLPDRIARINTYYAGRYPDGQSKPSSKGTNAVDDVDSCIFEIWDAFKILNEDFYFCSGIMTPIFVHHASMHEGKSQQYIQYSASIITDGNKAFSDRRMDIESGITRRLDAWWGPKAS